MPKRLGGPKKKSAGVALTHMWTRGSLQWFSLCWGKSFPLKEHKIFPKFFGNFLRRTRGSIFTTEHAWYYTLPPCPSVKQYDRYLIRGWTRPGTPSTATFWAKMTVVTFPDDRPNVFVANLRLHSVCRKPDKDGSLSFSLLNKDRWRQQQKEK